MTDRIYIETLIEWLENDTGIIFSSIKALGWITQDEWDALMLGSDYDHCFADMKQTLGMFVLLAEGEEF